VGKGDFSGLTSSAHPSDPQNHQREQKAPSYPGSGPIPCRNGWLGISVFGSMGDWINWESINGDSLFVWGGLGVVVSYMVSVLTNTDY
jgi:hypothetical protein